MEQVLIDKVEDIARQTIFRWCKDTFEGEMSRVLANACKVVATNQLIGDIDPLKDLNDIEIITKNCVMRYVKEYINTNF